MSWLLSLRQANAELPGVITLGAVSDGYGTLLDDVSVLPISIEISKQADRRYVCEGGTINYTYIVHNDGDIPLSPVLVTDSLPITVTPMLVPPRPGFNTGDLNQDGILDPCEDWQYTASYTVPDPCDRIVIPNTATVVAGTGSEPVTRVSAQSNPVEVPVLHPSIEISKEADREYVSECATINYLYRVHNDGDIPLAGPVVVSDTLPITPTPVLPDGIHNRGDLNLNGKLDPCETWYFTASYTVPTPCDRPAIVNIATAVAGTGLQPPCPTRVSATSDRVRVVVVQLVRMGPLDDANPVGKEHCVTALVDPPVGGIDVSFWVTGANPTTATVTTLRNGQATFCYTGSSLGTDTIRAYLDNGNHQLDRCEPYIEAIKEWYCQFLTGGGNINGGEKKLWTFGGNVANLWDGSVRGQFQIRDHAGKESWHCHNDFDSLTFWGGPTASPPASLDHAQFVGTFTSNKGNTKYLQVEIWDDQEPGRDFDEIRVWYDTDENPATIGWTRWFWGIPIDGGNLQVHDVCKR